MRGSNECRDILGLVDDGVIVLIRWWFEPSCNDTNLHLRAIMYITVQL